MCVRERGRGREEEREIDRHAHTSYSHTCTHLHALTHAHAGKRVRYWCLPLWHHSCWVLVVQVTSHSSIASLARLKSRFFFACVTLPRHHNSKWYEIYFCNSFVRALLIKVNLFDVQFYYLFWSQLRKKYIQFLIENGVWICSFLLYLFTMMKHS